MGPVMQVCGWAGDNVIRVLLLLTHQGVTARHNDHHDQTSQAVDASHVHMLYSAPPTTEGCKLACIADTAISAC
jgi:hypothetical protein